VTLEIPKLPQLQGIVDASPCGDQTYLVTAFKRPFSAGGFDNRFRKWCDQARIGALLGPWTEVGRGDAIG